MAADKDSKRIDLIKERWAKIPNPDPAPAIDDFEGYEKTPAKAYRTIEETIDENGIPSRLILCPSLERAIIKRPSSISGWQCESYIEENSRCSRCKYFPEDVCKDEEE